MSPVGLRPCLDSLSPLPERVQRDRVTQSSNVDLAGKVFLHVSVPCGSSVDVLSQCVSHAFLFQASVPPFEHVRGDM